MKRSLKFNWKKKKIYLEEKLEGTQQLLKICGHPKTTRFAEKSTTSFDSCL